MSVTAIATDRDIVQALVMFLEDRRVLFNLDYLEIESQVDSSVEAIRRELTEAMQQLDPKNSAMLPLSTMRSACRRFQDGPRERMRLLGGGRETNDSAGFLVALGELRGVFGAELKRLDVKFGLRIENQLRSIFPNDENAR